MPELCRDELSGWRRGRKDRWGFGVLKEDLLRRAAIAWCEDARLPAAEFPCRFGEIAGGFAEVASLS